MVGLLTLLLRAIFPDQVSFPQLLSFTSGLSLLTRFRPQLLHLQV
jgi:hypothetical protein